MTQRTVKDDAGRTWTCETVNARMGADGAAAQGHDIELTCTTPGVKDPVTVRVGWGWETMADNGLARMIALASPAAKR